MESADWDRIKQIFSAAVSVPAAERDAYVRSACGQRHDIEQVVDDLLRAHYDASQSFLEPESLVFTAAWLFREGDRVGSRYTVVRRIARGAMGEVYQVYDERLRFQVALKAIRPELIGDADTAERFRREVLVTRGIAHAGLCRVFDLVDHAIGAQAGFPEGTIVPCLTMQLLEGDSLEDWLTTGRPMSVQQALPLLKQIAEALQVLHDAGVVHRDLKPSNVMLVPAAQETRAVLTDFGLAKPLDEGVFETKTHVQGGAPFFMAPELLRGEKPSRASDIYAFGLLIDEMVTGRRAFSAESLHALLLQKLGDGPELPSRRATGLPRSWEQTILRCLARDPRDRFASVTEVMEGLADEGTAPRRWLGIPGVRTTSQRRHRRLAGYAIAGAIALTAMAAIPVWPEVPTSIEIRPFKNLTGSKDFDYIGTGTSGELGRRLSRLLNLRVYTPTDTAGAVNPSRRPMYSLQGHVQWIRPTLRITVQLTDTAQQTLVWSQNFDGTPEQSLQLEDKLAAETVGTLRRVHPGDRAGPIGPVIAQFKQWLPFAGSRVPASGTTNDAAHEAYMHGWALFQERTLPTALNAIEYLKRAVQEDPNYADAYATLADVQGVLMDNHYAPHSMLMAEADRYATQAVALNPDLSDAQLSLAALRQMQWRWTDADTAYRRAIALQPTFARAHRWYGGLLLQFGRFDESLALYRRSIELDPWDSASQSGYGHALFNAGRPTEAAAHLERVLAEKNVFNAHALLGQIYAYLGAADSARRDDYVSKALEQSAILREQELAARKAAGKPPVTEYAELTAALAWSYQGNLASAAPFVERLEAWHAQGFVSPGVLARVYAAQGNAPRAIDALLQAENEKDRELFYINVSPQYAGIRNEPPFRALVQRLDLSR